jgi:hypothetical protein
MRREGYETKDVKPAEAAKTESASDRREKRAADALKAEQEKRAGGFVKKDGA